MEERLNNLLAKFEIARLDQVGILARMEGLAVEIRNAEADEEYLTKLVADLDNMLERLKSNKKLMLEVIEGMDSIQRELNQEEE
jgi:hypothetical protein